MASTPETIDDYIDSFPADVQEIGAGGSSQDHER